MSEEPSAFERFRPLTAVLENLLKSVRGTHMPAKIEKCSSDRVGALCNFEIDFDRRLRNRERLLVCLFDAKFRLADFEALAKSSRTLPKKARLIVGAASVSNFAKKRIEKSDWCSGWFDSQGDCLLRSDYLHIEINRASVAAKRGKREESSSLHKSTTTRILRALIDPDEWSRKRFAREVCRSFPGKGGPTWTSKLVKKYVEKGCIERTSSKARFEITKPLVLFEDWVELSKSRIATTTIHRYQVDIAKVRESLLAFPEVAFTAESAYRYYRNNEFGEFVDPNVHVRAWGNSRACLDFLGGIEVNQGGNLMVFESEDPFDVRTVEIELIKDETLKGLHPIEKKKVKVTAPLDAYLDLVSLDSRLGRDFYEGVLLPLYQQKKLNKGCFP